MTGVIKYKNVKKGVIPGNEEVERRGVQTSEHIAGERGEAGSGKVCLYSFRNAGPFIMGEDHGRPVQGLSPVGKS